MIFYSQPAPVAMLHLLTTVQQLVKGLFGSSAVVTHGPSKYIFVSIVTKTHPKSNNFRFRLKYLLIHFPIFSNSFVCIFRNLYLSLENNKTNELKGDDEPFSPDTHGFFWYICFRSALATPGLQQRCKQKLHHISSANYK